MKARMRLRRSDGQVYMDRWGREWRPEPDPDRPPHTSGIPGRRVGIGGIYVHRFTAPDPGIDLHDHPWSAIFIVLRGGYTEELCDTSNAPQIAAFYEDAGLDQRGVQRHHRAGSIRRHPLGLAHRITELHRPVVWTLVIHGPWRRLWGFYTPDGWVESHDYDQTVRAGRRDLWNEVSS